jgi:hypothetical protein
VQINRLNDPLIKLSEEALNAITAGCAPGRFLVDVFPVLKYVPGWMPGAGFQAQGREWGAAVTRMCDASYEANVKASVRLPKGFFYYANQFLYIARWNR